MGHPIDGRLPSSTERQHSPDFPGHGFEERLRDFVTAGKRGEPDIGARGGQEFRQQLARMEREHRILAPVVLCHPEAGNLSPPLVGKLAQSLGRDDAAGKKKEPSREHNTLYGGRGRNHRALAEPPNDGPRRIAAGYIQQLIQSSHGIAEIRWVKITQPAKIITGHERLDA